MHRGDIPSSGTGRTDAETPQLNREPAKSYAISGGGTSRTPAIRRPVTTQVIFSNDFWPELKLSVVWTPGKGLRSELRNERDVLPLVVEPDLEGWLCEDFTRVKQLQALHASADVFVVVWPSKLWCIDLRPFMREGPHLNMFNEQLQFETICVDDPTARFSEGGLWESSFYYPQGRNWVVMDVWTGVPSPLRTSIDVGCCYLSAGRKALISLVGDMLSTKVLQGDVSAETMMTFRPDGLPTACAVVDCGWCLALVTFRQDSFSVYAGPHDFSVWKEIWTSPIDLPTTPSLTVVDRCLLSVSVPGQHWILRLPLDADKSSFRLEPTAETTYVDWLPVRASFTVDDDVCEAASAAEAAAQASSPLPWSNALSTLHCLKAMRDPWGETTMVLPTVNSLGEDGFSGVVEALARSDNALITPLFHNWSLVDALDDDELLNSSLALVHASASVEEMSGIINDLNRVLESKLQKATALHNENVERTQQLTSRISEACSGRESYAALVQSIQSLRMALLRGLPELIHADPLRLDDSSLMDTLSISPPSRSCAYKPWLRSTDANWRPTKQEFTR
ncbi:MAG: hypothetical protein KVP17_004761 [Porospora cf. gigantea B]|uniref:uncharacterized protein n=1 Tax=Porospora cf. gigantea B TaxID=2853592 RepID=UPI0035719362|nr:MAG: hypothetical protein KVP17_004761 [Porospora cf. gigantea B]